MSDTDFLVVESKEVDLIFHTAYKDAKFNLISQGNQMVTSISSSPVGMKSAEHEDIPVAQEDNIA